METCGNVYACFSLHVKHSFDTLLWRYCSVIRPSTVINCKLLQVSCYQLQSTLTCSYMVVTLTLCKKYCISVCMTKSCCNAALSWLRVEHPAGISWSPAFVVHLTSLVFFVYFTIFFLVIPPSAVHCLFCMVIQRNEGWRLL